ncbi:MAG: serine/threonine protein kinase [Armatimonadetes bacterium]|nr:serine/threonine protein kinase [Armatimonadota bacterium]
MTNESLRRVGGYELLELIGSGGMSQVYRTRRVDDGLIVALKAIRMEDVDTDYERRLRREPEVQQGAGHQNIVGMLDWFREHDTFYVVMEYVAGRSLAQVIYKESGPLPFQKASEYIRQALAGLAHLHSLGIIHRDIKPSNLLVGWDGILRLADFGIAKFVWQQGETRTQKGLGTPEYMSPEQARGAHIDHRTDLYSLGITLFELLTARKPFARSQETPIGYAEVIQGVLTAQLPDPRAFQPTLPASVARLLHRATAKNPDERFQTAGEFLSALEMVDTASETPFIEPPFHDPAATVVAPTVVAPTVVAPTVAAPTVAAGVGGTSPQLPPQPQPQSQSQPQQPTPSEKRKPSNAPLWIILAAIVLGVGGYFGMQWYQQQQGLPGDAGVGLSATGAFELSRKIALDYQMFSRSNNSSALASLYAERDVEYFRLKRTTRTAIERDMDDFYQRITETPVFELDVKNAQATNDSTITTEWWITYERLREDKTILRGQTSNLLTIQRRGGEWLIVRQSQKWIKRDDVAPPIDTPVVKDIIPPPPPDTASVQPPPSPQVDSAGGTPPSSPESQRRR